MGTLSKITKPKDSTAVFIWNSHGPAFVLRRADRTSAPTLRSQCAIAHRLSTIAALDRLIVLDEGRIVEEGTHYLLLVRGGLYAQLWKRQSGGFLGDRLAAE